VVQEQRLEVSVAVVFAGLVVLVIGARRSQLLKPLANVFD